jgi:hypothetical protein
MDCSDTPSSNFKCFLESFVGFEMSSGERVCLHGALIRSSASGVREGSSG